MFSEDFLSAANPWLLDGEVVAAVVLGIGILFETDKFKRNNISGLAFQLVMWGVIFETVFSVMLFRSETLITDRQRSTISAQQSTIGVLDQEVIDARKLAAPRDISGNDRRIMSSSVSKCRGTPYDLSFQPTTDRFPFPDLLEHGSNLISDLIVVLDRLAGWKLRSVEGGAPKALLPWYISALTLSPEAFKKGTRTPLILRGVIAGISGVRVPVDPKSKQRDDCVSELVHALNKVGIPADFDLSPPNNDIPVGALTGDAVHIVVGTKY